MSNNQFFSNERLIAIHFIYETIQTGDFSLATEAVIKKGKEAIDSEYNKLSPTHAVKYLEKLLVKVQKYQQRSLIEKHDNLLELLGKLLNLSLFRKYLKEPISEQFNFSSSFQSNY